MNPKTDGDGLDFQIVVILNELFHAFQADQDSARFCSRLILSRSSFPI